MRDVNKIILVGRLGADPIERTTTQGTPVVHFPLATASRPKKQMESVEEESSENSGESLIETSKGGGKEAKEGNDSSENTQWHRVVVWGKQGQACSQYLKKGNAVFIEGSVKSRKFDGADGNTRYSFEVHAESVSFLGGLTRGPRRGAQAESQTEASFEAAH